jgi:UDP-N-acetylglucosamine 2-epimerase (non-hydrolysing)
MSIIFFKYLNMPTPDNNLNFGPGKADAVITAMKDGIEKAILLEKPDWESVYGDTNSTLSGDLKASKLQIPSLMWTQGCAALIITCPRSATGS